MNLYDIRAHVLRSETVQALEPEVVVALAQIAEDALDLTGTSYTGTAAERAAHAVVRQVNRMAAEPGDPYLSSHAVGEESKSWDSRAAASTVTLDPYAKMIVEQLASEAGTEAGAYTTVRSFR